MARHANLRASFQHANLSRPVQVIVPRLEVPWRELDLSTVAEAEQATRVAQITAEERARPFDLAVPPLLRFTLIRLGV